MKKNPTKLFKTSGRISLKEYVEDIKEMRINGPWKLPLNLFDRIQFFFLSVFLKFSYFADRLYIAYPEKVRPSYSLLLNFLHNNSVFDSFEEREVIPTGVFSYFLQKKEKFREGFWFLSGQGVDKDRSVAISKAIGEMIERSISGRLDMNPHIVSASSKDMQAKWRTLFPSKYHRFLEVQRKKYIFLNHDELRPIAWVEGYDLISQKSVYIPKQVTSWFSGNHDAHEVFVNATTNGAAGFFTKEGAVLRGMLEIVQRDAFLVHWLTRIAPEVVLKETLPTELQQRIKELESHDLKLYVLNVTSISIPSIIIVAIETNLSESKIALSGATNLTFAKAIDEALTEMSVSVGIFHSKEKDLKFKKEKVEPFISQIGQFERFHYWKQPNMVRHFEWFINGAMISYEQLVKQDLILGSEKQNLKQCLDILKQKGEGYYPVVYYPKNKIQEKVGFYIAQVYIPKAFPLYLVEYEGTFDSDRLDEFALSKGVTQWNLNEQPHMFI